MGKSKIEWTDKVWNPVTGCTKLSAGCRNCYASRMAPRLAGRFGYPADDPFKVTLHADRLNEPLNWKKPRRIFACSMADLFHDDVPGWFVRAIFAVIASCPQHTFLILTKRPKNMLYWFSFMNEVPSFKMTCAAVSVPINYSRALDISEAWPLPNIQIGVSVENQATADERIPYLLQIPAAKRFISIEPILGEVNLKILPHRIFGELDTKISGKFNALKDSFSRLDHCVLPGLDGVILGGESGPGARPMHPGWARKVRDDCAAAGVPFFYKQGLGDDGEWSKMPALDGKVHRGLA